MVMPFDTAQTNRRIGAQDFKEPMGAHIANFETEIVQPLGGRNTIN